MSLLSGRKHFINIISRIIFYPNLKIVLLSHIYPEPDPDDVSLHVVPQHFVLGVNNGQSFREDGGRRAIQFSLEAVDDGMADWPYAYKIF